MLNRRLVIGSLVAGAFLMPAVAGAAVQGACATCHTMHSHQNGAPEALSQGTLLRASASCVSCHAIAGVENDNTGRGADAIKAPQVDQDASAVQVAFINNAGFFDSAANPNTHHNVVGIDAAGDANMPPAANAPGLGTMPVFNGAAPTLTCVDCHSGSGAHHGTSTTYRIVGAVDIATSAQADFGAAADSATIVNGTRSEVTYNATNLNSFCAGCHPEFHQAALGFVGAGDQQSATAGTWIRHPTDISLAGAGPSIVAGLNATNDTDEVVLGVVGAVNDVVMCISCHVPHGGRYADLLAFPYDAATNAAGDTTKDTGCETCHSYGGNGM